MPKKSNDRGLIARKTADGTQVWNARLQHQGKVHWFGSFPTKTEARQFREEAKTDLRRGQFFPQNLQHRGGKRLDEAIEEFMRFNKKRTVGNDRIYEKFWRNRLPNHRLINITPALLDSVKGELLEKGLANQTVLHYLKFLRHILNLAVRDRSLVQNPFSQIEMPKVSKGRLRYLSLEEEKQLLESIAPTFAPWVRFAILTGLRQTEQFRLKWTDIDLERGILTLPATKTGHCQYAYLNEEAKGILKNWTSWRDSKWVFPSQTKGTPVDPKNFYKRIFVPAVQKANLFDVNWHTMRHTFASRLAMSGATEQEIATCLRHSSTALVKRYAHLSQPHLHTVLEKISGFGQHREESPRPERTVAKTEIGEERTGGEVAR